MNRIDVIKSILNKRESKMVHCDKCNRDYLPMAQSSVDTCPICGHNHFGDDIDLDIIDEELLGITFSDDQLAFNN